MSGTDNHPNKQASAKAPSKTVVSLQEFGPECDKRWGEPSSVQVHMLIS